MKHWVTVMVWGALCGVFVGCRRETPPASREAASAPETRVTETNGRPKSVNEMAPEDVIVSVNGAPLTKKRFTEGMAQIKRDILRTVRDPQQQMQEWTLAGKTFIPRFVELQLLEQEARKKGVLGAEELARRSTALMEKTARREQKKLADFAAGFPGGEAALRRDAEQTVLINAFVSNCIPPKVVVDDAFVQKAMASIQADNDAIAVSNRVKVARLNDWRKELLAGKDFDALARDFSECPRSSIEHGGYWGEFERDDFKNPNMRDTIFDRLKIGEISEVLEDDEAYHLVKVLQRVPPKQNEKGRLIKPETLKLAHIMLFKDPPLELYQPQGLKKDLTKQMQMQAIDAYVQKLKETAVVVYPNGTNFWSGVRKPEVSARPQKRVDGQ